MQQTNPIRTLQRVSLGAAGILALAAAGRAEARWEKQLSKPANGNFVLEVAAGSENNVILAGAEASASGQTPVVKFSTDGGGSWSNSTVPGGGRIPNVIRSIDFSAPATAYGVDTLRGQILLSTDGGANFAEAASGLLPRGSVFTTIFMLDASHGWAGSRGGKIALTTDGRKWTLAETGQTIDMAGVQFVSASNGFAWGHPPKPDANAPATTPTTILQSGDGGKTWAVLSTLPIGDAIVHFYDCSTGYAAGVDSSGSPQFHATSDGGKSWKSLSTSLAPIEYEVFGRKAQETLNSITGLHALGPGELILTGNKIYPDNQGTPLGGVFRSGDGGATWQPDPEYMTMMGGGVGAAVAVLSLTCPNANRCWIGGDRFLVARWTRDAPVNQPNAGKVKDCSSPGGPAAGGGPGQDGGPNPQFPGVDGGRASASGKDSTDEEGCGCDTAPARNGFRGWIAALVAAVLTARIRLRKSHVQD
ncbi:MAG: hypothetical protein GMKNLPBB_00351 [Myxococcota bacterium]|nr:hypothetical protein [Myxococcota bacterium]